MASNFKSICNLHESIKSFNVEIVRQAYKYDSSSLNTLDPTIGWSVLYKAIVYEQLELAKFLLELGAEPNLPNKIGESPLHYAAEIGKTSFVDLLLKNGADPNLKQSDGNSSFLIACKKNHIAVINLMLSYRIDVNTQNKLGRTPLHFVANSGNTELYELLVKHGADPEMKDKWGKKPKTLDVIKQEKDLPRDSLRKSTSLSQQIYTRLNSGKETPRLKEREPIDKENIKGRENMQKTFRRAVPVKALLHKKKEESASSPMKAMKNISNEKPSIQEKEKVLENSTKDILGHSRTDSLNETLTLLSDRSDEKAVIQDKRKVLEDSTKSIVLHSRTDSLDEAWAVFSDKKEDEPKKTVRKTEERLKALQSMLAMKKSYSEKTLTLSKNNSLTFGKKDLSNLLSIPLEEEEEISKEVNVKFCSETIHKKGNSNPLEISTEDAETPKPSILAKALSLKQFVDQSLDDYISRKTNYSTNEKSLSSDETLQLSHYERLEISTVDTLTQIVDVKPPTPELPVIAESNATPCKEKVENELDSSHAAASAQPDKFRCTPKETPKTKQMETERRLLNKNLTNIFCSQGSLDKKSLEARRERLSLRHGIFDLEINCLDEYRMADWLLEFGLEEQRMNFADNGYVYYSKFKMDYGQCKAIFKDLRFRFGIDKFGHRCRIVMRLREDSGLFIRKGLFKFNGMHRSCKLQFPSVREWLTSLGYDDYIENFIDNGFDSLEYVILQTSFKELMLDEFLMRDEIGIKNKRIRDDILKRLRHIYQVASEMDPSNYDSERFCKLLCTHDYGKTCSIF